jgi:predicted TIM-barrel fold metal-dependent hydrolase
MSHREGGLQRLICDSQVHAPNTPHAGPIEGMEPEHLLAEMDRAGVTRCVIIPMVPPGDDASRSNPAALAVAASNLNRFAVMAPFDLTRPANARLLPAWRAAGGMLGVRLAFLRDPNLALLTEGRLEWFWSSAEEAGVPIMLLAPNSVDQIAQVAEAHPRLRLVIDHLNLHPSTVYADLALAVRPLLALAKNPNVAVKASALPCWANDEYPFRSVHGALSDVVAAFGPRRVFWGSDLTRLPCPYSDCVRLFTEAVPFLSEVDKDWIMGRAVMEWLGWDPDRSISRWAV